MKQKLTIAQQVEHMKNSGIKFDIVNEIDAINYITYNTYYFKLKAYAKNFNKNNLSQYVNLDFGHLKELSIIDTHLRRTILHLCLNLEHAIKVFTNAHFSNNLAEDGYSIVQSFIKEQESKKYVGIKKINAYTDNLQRKYNTCPALWNYMETLSFGELIAFYKHYFKIYDVNLYKMHPLLFAAHNLRNATAHNNCLLLNTPCIKPTYKIVNMLKKGGFSSNSVDAALKMPAINDFAAVLYCFNFFVKSSATREKSFIELKNLKIRFNKNMHFFDKNQNLKNILNFFLKLIDFFVN